MFTAVAGLRRPAYGRLADSRVVMGHTAFVFLFFYRIDEGHAAAVDTATVVSRLSSANVSPFVVSLIKIRQTASRYRLTPLRGAHPDGGE